MELDSKRGIPRLRAFQRKYIAEWSNSSVGFESQGAYEWMANQLALHCSPKRILDIGCGSGLGIDSLLNKFGKDTVVLSLEQNEKCITNAQAAQGREWKAILRADPEFVSANGYLIKFKQGLLPKTIDGVSLIESDVLFDPEIEAYLEGLPKFDAVTIWLIGAQQGMEDCINLSSLNVTSSGDLRLRIQNKVYELADKILRPGGILQVVDRCEYPTSNDMIEDGLRSHREQASVTSLNVITSSYMEYTEPTLGAVGMTVTRGSSGRIGNTDRRALRSTISVKPPLAVTTTDGDPVSS